ncbi:MAG: glutamate-5-semialdehyde dehydrogenase [Lachnospiraceae bacterium]|nr:glutamate-5-semialdehyde dehydrogenase [Lachnospiraceae bacterium]
MTINELTRKMKLISSPQLSASSSDARNKALLAIAEALKENSEKIFEANAKDLANADASGVPTPVKKRLKFDEAKLSGCLSGIEDLVNLEDPLRKVTLDRELDEVLVLTRLTCPIGVIGVIFEARPDALVQISTLCLKSGNCAVLKGGSETRTTNRVLFDIIYEAALSAGLPENCLALCEERSEISELLKCEGNVDLIIPRGSNAFVRYIMDNTHIPVMGHADGICHTYIDAAADAEKAVKIVTDAKTQYVSVCNATETLLVNRNVVNTILPKVRDALLAKNVKIRSTAELAPVLNGEIIADDDFANEYLDYIIAVKAVDSVDEAIAHINRFGSHHTDAIITEDRAAADRFCALVDSADVFVNCSTRFADGYRFGFGAEVGISTGKLHARGPVGLEGLVTYKYRLEGNGHIVADYAEGRRSFNFKDL